MDKVNFVTGFMPDKPDFDRLQNSLEGGLENVAGAVAGKGIKTGFDVTIVGSTASASAGVGFDGLGRILIKKTPIAVDLGTLTRPARGQYRWVTIVLKYKVTERGQVLDISNHPQPANYLDDAELEIIDSATDGSASSISKPAVTDYQVPLLDIRLDETSPWGNLVTDSSRKPGLIPTGELKKYTDGEVVKAKSYADGEVAKAKSYTDGEVVKAVAKLSSDIDKTAHLPVGLIWMYDGTNWVDNRTLPGWFACVSGNQSRGCPNLVDRFVMGKGVSRGGSYGGNNSHRISINEMPRHNHGGTVSSVSMSHRHTIPNLRHRHQISYTFYGPGPTNVDLHYTGLGTGAYSNIYTDYMNLDPGATGVVSQSHSHNISSEGNGQAMDMRPAYYSVIFIRKCA